MQVKKDALPSVSRRTFIAGACTAAGLAALSRISLVQPALAYEGGTSMTVAWTSNQGDYSLDPAYNYMGWQGSYLGIYEQLYRINGSFEPEAFLAESAEPNEDYSVWTITIRGGITFQNGNPCDAAAVKASLERAIKMNPLGVASIEADGQTLTVTLEVPNVGFANELCEPVTSIIDTQSGTADEMPVGTGPFAMESVDAMGNVELDAYADYWQGKPAVGHVTALYITDDASKVAALQSGEVQALMNIGDDQLPLFQNNTDFSVNQTNQARSHMLYFNMRNETMQDPLVRQAICKCVNRDGYVNAIYGGCAEAAPGIFPAESGYADGVSQETYDLDGARALLEQAGYTEVDGHLEKDGQPLTLTFCTYVANAALPKVCEVMASDLASIGVTVNIEVAEKIAERLGADDWHVGTMAYSTLPTGNPSTYLNAVVKSDGGANYGSYANEEVDALLHELAETADHDERAAIVEQVQNIALGEWGYCYIVHALVNDVCASNVADLAMQGQYDWLNYKMSISE